MADGREEIALEFDEFGKFLLGGLPRSASRDRSWWANSDGSPGRVQAHAWLDAGYCVDWVDLKARVVRFRRMGTDHARRPTGR